MKILLRRQGTCHECIGTPQRLEDARKGSISVPKPHDKAKCLGAGAETQEVALPGFLGPMHRLIEARGSEGQGEYHWMK